MLKIAALLLVVFGVASAAPSFDERIVGGTDAELGEYPYIISFRKYGRHSCGGSILSEKYILTAAHCVAGSENNPEIMSIEYGVVDITNDENVIQVVRVMRHEKYSPGGQYPNDVAILELEKNIPFSANASPVKLPSASTLPGDDVPAVLIGWGYNKTNSVVMHHLQKVNIIRFSDEKCEGFESYYNREVHVCAGIPGGGKGQCSGDSGGPLTVDGVQFGVVSWSVKPCSSNGHPGIFAKVTAYRNWIKEKCGV